MVAKDLAWHYGATLHIVHVMVNFSVSPPLHSTYMPIEYDPKFVEEVAKAAKEAIENRYVAALKEKQPYEVHLLSGYSSTEILRLAKEMTST